MFIKHVPGFNGWHPGVVRDYDHLINLASDNFELETIGESTDGDYPIYGTKIGDLTAGNTLYICAGIHAGTEWIAPYYALEFMTALKNPEAYPQEFYLKWIMKQYDAVYLVVCANPWAFVNGTRRNKNDVDLNRDFGSSSPQAETVVIENSVREIKPTVLIDCHERTPSGGVGIASIDNWRGPVDDDYLHKTYRAIRYLDHLVDDVVDYHGVNASEGELRRWAASEVENAQGGQIYSFITEPGDLGPTDAYAVDRSRRGINALFAIGLALNEVLKGHSVLVKVGDDLKPLVPMLKVDGELKPFLTSKMVD